MTTIIKLDLHDHERLTFHFNQDRRINMVFDASQTSRDGGLDLLRQMDERLQLAAAIAVFLQDRSNQNKAKRTRVKQLRKRVCQNALGYEDPNDASSSRDDPLWKTALDRLSDSDDGLCL